MLFCPFSLLFAAFWSSKLPFQLSLQYVGVGTFIFHRFCNNLVEFVTFWSGSYRLFAAFLSSNLMFDGICNILVLELFLLHGSLQLGFI